MGRCGQCTIVDKVDVLAEERDDNTAKYVVRANIVGHLEEGGLYRADNGELEAKFTLVRDDGEWRIDELPPGVIMDKPRFLNSYQRRSLYFVTPDGSTVVPDPRWISGTPEQAAAQLIGLLIEGPKPSLAPAVHNELADATILGAITKADGRTGQVGVGLGGIRVDFGGLTSLTEPARELLAAQVIWTLANAEIAGPYVLLADGRPLDERYPNGWTTADVASMNPLATSGTPIGLHAVLGGGLVNVAETGVTPVQASSDPSTTFVRSGCRGTAHCLQQSRIPADRNRNPLQNSWSVPTTTDRPSRLSKENRSPGRHGLPTAIRFGRSSTAQLS